jgi:hypothetical protein
MAPKETEMNSATIASAAAFAFVLLMAPAPAGAQWSEAQRAACMGDAQRLCASSLASPGQLNACMQRNAGKVSAGCRAAMGGGKSAKKKKRA